LACLAVALAPENGGASGGLEGVTHIADLDIVSGAGFTKVEGTGAFGDLDRLATGGKLGLLNAVDDENKNDLIGMVASFILGSYLKT
jgi:hypothetical protein